MSDERDALEPELDAEQERALAEALVCAVAPAPIDPARHEAILQRAGIVRPPDEDDEDPFRPPTEEEQRQALALAQALDAGTPHPDAALARALRLAAGGAVDRDPPVEEILGRALRRAERPKVLYLRVGAAAALLAAAASVALVLGVQPERAEDAPELVVSRSLSPLFATETGALSASARLDRIANARARDLRNNRYARWGVR